MSNLFIPAVVILLDQSTKYLIRQAFSFGESVPLIGFIHLTYHKNTGAAFGLLEGRTSWLAAVSVLFIIAAVIYLTRHPKGLSAFALSLVLGGAVGNAIDRIRFGYVVDFVDLRVWPIFNIADASITCGVALILWKALSAPRMRSSA